jgi:hypothetical protein
MLPSVSAREAVGKRIVMLIWAIAGGVILLIAIVLIIINRMLAPPKLHD